MARVIHDLPLVDYGSLIGFKPNILEKLDLEKPALYFRETVIIFIFHSFHSRIFSYLECFSN